MNAITYMMIEHPFTSIWLALIFVLWVVIYASTYRKEPPTQDRRARPPTSAQA